MRSVSCILPINLRSGSGSFFMRVGAAMICSPFARTGLLVDVDNLQFIAVFQVLFADLLDIEDGLCGARRGTGYIEAQKHTSCLRSP